MGRDGRSALLTRLPFILQAPSDGAVLLFSYASRADTAGRTARALDGAASTTCCREGVLRQHPTWRHRLPLALDPAACLCHRHCPDGVVARGDRRRFVLPASQSFSASLRLNTGRTTLTNLPSHFCSKLCCARALCCVVAARTMLAWACVQRCEGITRFAEHRPAAAAHIQRARGVCLRKTATSFSRHRGGGCGVGGTFQHYLILRVNLPASVLTGDFTGGFERRTTSSSCAGRTDVGHCGVCALCCLLFCWRWLPSLLATLCWDISGISLPHPTDAEDFGCFICTALAGRSLWMQLFVAWRLPRGYLFLPYCWRTVI